MGVPETVRQALAERYLIERELGRGGMGAVYLARDLRHDRPVALKVLLPELAANSGAERFQREIHFAARLQHPHILTVLESGEVSDPEAGVGHLWFTMPSVDGESLRDRLRREGRLPREDALRITTRATSGTSRYSALWRWTCAIRYAPSWTRQRRGPRRRSRNRDMA